MDATLEGMHTEVIALEKHRTGQVVNKDEDAWYPNHLNSMGSCE